jgi:methionyl-tRNA formyltransferase
MQITPKPISLVFFGSFGKYSALVLERLIKAKELDVVAAVTTLPVLDRKKKLVKNEVQTLAEKSGLKTLTPIDIKTSDFLKKLPSADLFLTVGYGKILPSEVFSHPKYGSLNLHFSLLPKYRGANPGEWAILMDEKTTGISVITMNRGIDTGAVVFRQEIPLGLQDTRETLYQKLYLLGGEKLPDVITNFVTGKLPTAAQPENNLPYASRFRREDGQVTWSAIKALMSGLTVSPADFSPKLQEIIKLLKLNSVDAPFVERAIRALVGFPNLWTLIPTAKGEKRMNILSSSLDGSKLQLKSVQIEGKNPALWNEVKNVVTD